LALVLSSVQADFSVRKLETLTSKKPGSGMDQATIQIFGYQNGGAYSVTLCNEVECCRTGQLDTQEDNWELGQVDWFVGQQIGGCYGFELPTDAPLKLLLNHVGSDAGRLEFIRVHSWHSASSFLCPINTRLDYKENFVTECQYEEHSEDQNQEDWCNGAKDFCDLKYNQYLFPGTHNSGTGQSDGVLECAFKNQDLSITEQLDFGIRFFDIDTIYSYGLPGCYGLETGHGQKPELGLYQCYGQLSDVFDGIGRWLDQHKSEVVTLNFGNIGFRETTVPYLVDALIEKFGSNATGTQLNTDYKEKGEWPSLATAVKDDKRIFAFMSDHSIIDEMGIVEAIKVKPNKPITEVPGAVTMMTSYKAKSVGDTCDFVFNLTAATCERVEGDLIKISVFSSYFKKGIDCLWHMAKICNPVAQQTLKICSSAFNDKLEEGVTDRFSPNYILLDYPNYQGTQTKSFIELCREENLERVAKIREIQAEE